MAEADHDIDREAHRLLQEILDEPTGSRWAALDRSCPHPGPLRSSLEALVRAADSSDRFLETPAWRGAEARRSSAEAGSRVGRFTLLERAGAGGMGDVFRAEQDAPRRVVAVKLIRAEQPSEHALRRFALEAEALGRLQHPHIAHVIEAGTASTSRGATPFVAMEWIDDARTLLDFVAEEALDLEARLRRFLDITAAISHAHGRGVIHRDLKPENILVGGDGLVKVIDFGVALLADHATRATLDNQFVGSLGSMSPEQCDGRDIDVRTDVYALGTLLHELVEGKPPFDFAGVPITQAIERIRTVDPPAARSAGIDMGIVIAKALAKRADDRYPSVEALARDVENVLAHRPIEAHPPTLRHRLRLLARRHRSAVIAATVATFALFSGAAALTVGYLRAQAAEAETSRRNVELARVSEFLRSLIANDQYDRGKATRTIESELDGWAKRAEHEFADMPAARAILRREIGRNLIALGRYAEAKPILEGALADHLLAGRPDDRDTILTRGAIARLLRDSGEVDAALAAFERLVPEAIAALGEHPVYVDVIRGDYAILLTTLKRTDEAAAILEAVLANRLAKLGRESLPTAATLGQLGRVRFAQHRDEEAERLYREAVAIEDAIEGSLLAAASTRNNLATVLRRMGREREANALYNEIYQVRLREQGPDHPDTLVVQANIGTSALALGDHADACRVLTDCYERHVRILGATKRGTVITGLNLLRAHSVGEAWQAAVDLAPPLRRSLEAAQPQFGSSNWRVPWCDCLHGRALIALDRADEGLPLLEAGIRGLETSQEPEAVKNLGAAREWLASTH